MFGNIQKRRRQILFERAERGRNAQSYLTRIDRLRLRQFIGQIPKKVPHQPLFLRQLLQNRRKQLRARDFTPVISPPAYKRTLIYSTKNTLLKRWI